MNALRFALVLSLAACASQPPPEPKAKAPPPEHHDARFDKSAADLDAEVAKATAGFTPEGAELKGTLDAFTPASVPMQRGKCYKVVMRLSADAAFSDYAKKAVSFVVTGVPHEGEIMGGPGVVGPGGVAGFGCRREDAPGAKLDIQAISMSAVKPGRLHELGHGGFTLQIYTKQIGENEMSAQAADDAKQRGAIEDYKKKDTDKRCGECRRSKDLCLEGKRRPTGSSCVSDFDDCRFRAGIRDTCN